MADVKHVGRLVKTGRKVLIAYRTLPGDAYSCLVIPTENLQDEQHNPLIQLVESPAAQSAFEFAEVLARAKFPDGSTMLPALHTQGKLLKVPTDAVEVTPNFVTSIPLNELNQIIAEQQGVSVSDLAVRDPNAAKSNVEVQEVAQVTDMTASQASVDPLSNMSIEQRVAHLTAEAARLGKLAAEMIKQAEALVPKPVHVTEAVQHTTPMQDLVQAPATSAPKRKGKETAANTSESASDKQAAAS